MKTLKLDPVTQNYSTAWGAVKFLLDAAETGDKQAAELLVASVTNWIERLHWLAGEQPEMMKAIAAKSAIWPGFIAADRDYQKRELARAKTLGLGSESLLNYAGRKQWSRSTPEIKVAINLVGPLIGRRELPVFNKANYKAYYKAALPLLRLNYGDRFEEHPAFRRYARHYSAREKESLRPETKRRQMILTKLEQAFRTIAPAQ